MTDGRRSRWHAWDADFLGGKLGVGIRQRFGVCGVAVFLAYVSACKKNSVPGRITYMTDEEALSIMGLPGLRLVNERGEGWTLDMLWTYCGQQKVTSRRRRGDLTDIISTRWRRWQEDFGKQTEAEQKRRSRAEKTPTQQRQSDDAKPTDKDTDIDNDKDTKKPLALFDDFWRVYPRKVAKGAARKAWVTALRKGDPIEIIEGAARFAADPNLPPPTYTPHPSKWLNDERWIDGPLPSRTGTTPAAPSRDAGKLALLQGLREGA